MNINTFINTKDVSEVVITTAVGLLVLVAVFQMAPMLGNSIESATNLGDGVSATGVLDIVGAVADGETVTIGTTIFEFDISGGVASGNVAVPINDTTAVTAAAALATAITNNATAAALVTAVPHGAAA